MLIQVGRGQFSEAGLMGGVFPVTQLDARDACACRELSTEVSDIIVEKGASR